MAGSLDLFDALQEFFDVCLAATADTPEGQPSCAYISAGPPAWDTYPCLVVHSGGPALGDTFPLQPSLAPGHRATTNAQVNLVSMTCTILRCAAVIDDEGQLPTVEEHAAAAEQVCADLWAIWNHLREAKRNGDLFAPREREFFFDPAVPVNQQGGAAGWQITVRTALDGYRPTV